MRERCDSDGHASVLGDGDDLLDKKCFVLDDSSDLIPAICTVRRRRRSF